MSFAHWLVVLRAPVSTAGSAAYIRDTLRGKSKPNRVLAILLAAIGDGFASLPTIRKAWKFPETETGLTYMASFVSVLLILPSIPTWNIENSAFQVYLLIANTLLLLAVYRKRLGFGQ